MNYIESLQHAISYIEANILEDLSNTDISENVYMSNFHFQRTFSMFTGITLQEYIRNRRLSMAGQELLQSDIKIIDIALKYGYETPESFSRAFTRFHGITPTMAKDYGTHLKLYDPLVIRIKIQGGKAMKYRIEKKPAFDVIVKKGKFRNSIINEENNTEISNFWSECVQSNVFQVLLKDNACHGIYGVCGPASKTSNNFCYGVGVKLYNQDIPENYELWHLPEETWAIFDCLSSEEMGDVWSRIFNEFIPNSNYQIKDAADIEYYPNNRKDLFCEIWVPVTKN